LWHVASAVGDGGVLLRRLWTRGRHVVHTFLAKDEAVEVITSKIWLDAIDVQCEQRQVENRRTTLAFVCFET